MNNVTNLQKNIIIFGTPMLLIGLLVLLATSSILISNPKVLSFAITFDLLLITPVVYFLLIRKTSIPKTTVAPLLILGILVCTHILPQENHYFLNFFKTWVFPIVELSIFLIVIYHLRKTIKLFKLNKTQSSYDFFTTLKNTCYQVLPKAIVIPFVTEIAVLYYGFLNWKKSELKKNEFSYHKESGTIALLIATLFLIAIETVVFHILLTKWSNIAAYVLTFLSVYSGIQIFGFLKSMLRRPIVIKNNRIYLRYGMMCETTIEIKNIDSIEVSSKDIELNKDTRKLSFFGELESHNLIIRLKIENELIGLYGIKRKYKNIALYVDDKVVFKNRINKALSANN